MCLDLAPYFTSNFTKSVWLSFDVSKSNDRLANSVDPDQTAPIGAVWSGSTLFAHTYLSKYLAWIFYPIHTTFFWFFFWENMEKIARFHQEN